MTSEKMREVMRRNRIKRDITQQQIAERAGLDRRTVQSYEAGRSEGSVQMLLAYIEMVTPTVNVILERM